jgi:WD40 repeat protein
MYQLTSSTAAVIVSCTTLSLGSFLISAPLAAQTDSLTITLGCTPSEQASDTEGLLCETFHTRAIQAVTFSPDSQFIASGSADDTIKIWSVDAALRGDRATVVVRTIQNIDSVMTLAFNSTGTLLASGGGDGSVRLWDWQTGNLIDEMENYGEIITSVAFSPDGEILASAGYDNMIRLWDVETGDLIREIDGGQDVMAIAFSPDGETLASCGLSNFVNLWNVESGDEELSLRFSLPLQAIAFYPGGGAFAISPGSLMGDPNPSTAKDIQVWNIDGDRTTWTFEGHSSFVTALSFSLDGSRLVSGSEDNTVRVWDTQTGHIISTIEHSNFVNDVAIDPTKQYVVSGSTDNTMIFSRY